MKHPDSPIGTTGYILLGIYLEKRDRVAAHGEACRKYRAQVPMLVLSSKAGRAKTATSTAALSHR
jgi:hypothetical protein